LHITINRQRISYSRLVIASGAFGFARADVCIVTSADFFTLLNHSAGTVDIGVHHFRFSVVASTVSGILACYCQGSSCKWKRTGTPSTEGARIEAPKAPRGVVCGEGVSPSPQGEGSGEGAVPPPQNFVLGFRARNSVFGTFRALYFTIQLPALSTESGYIHVGDRYI